MKKTKEINKFYLEFPKASLLKITKLWFYLAIFSITVAGLFSLPPVLLRKSRFKDLENLEHIFSVSLVIHVNLSVLVWLLSITAMLWSLSNKEKLTVFNWAAPISSFFGAILMALSPFFGGGEALKNNYIPMFQNHLFIFGLTFFAIGIFIQVLLKLADFEFLKKKKDFSFALNFGLYSAALITFIAFICFFISGYEIRENKYSYLLAAANVYEHYFELLFWAGGHILQFTYTQVLILVWLYVAIANKAKISISPNLINILFIIGLVAIIPSPLIYIFYDIDAPEFIEFFTKQMQFAGGIAAFFAAIFVFFSLFEVKKKPEIFLILFSIILFGLGGILGLMISGANSKIPAHYHGSIVGVTLAFMALAYNFMPRFGFAEIKGKLANTQPFIYGIGQIMHITGLAWMGGYGALRKAPGTSDSIDTIAGKILFFSGGALAILGGLLFVVVIFRVFLKRGKG